MKTILNASRYLVIVGVIGALAAAITLFIYGGMLTFQQISDAIQSGYISAKGGKTLMLGFIEIADIFLLGTVMYIVALGLYELFIDDNIALPDWLSIHTIDDLKDKLLGVIVVVMGVVFLGHVIKWQGDEGILFYGIGIGSVIAALTFFSGLKKKKG